MSGSTSPSDTPISGRRAALATVMGAVAIFGLTLGLSYPLLSVVLEQRGTSGLWIGLNSAMTPLGFILGAPLVTWLGRRLGGWWLLLMGMAATALFLAGLGSTESLALWFPLRLGLGISINMLYIVSETWIILLAPAGSRGRILAVYTTLLSIGFGTGPAILALVGSQGFLPFGIAIAAIVLAALPLIPARRFSPRFEDSTAGAVFSVVPYMLGLLAIMFTLSAFDSATLALLPVYGLRTGLGEAAAAMTLTTLVFGNIALQYPMGWLADRIDKRKVIALCAAVGLTGALALLWLVGHWMLWPVLFVWGGITFAVYPVTLALLGERFAGASLLAGNAAFSMMWGLGGLVGPPVAGGAMEIFGPPGLPLVLAAIWGAFLLSRLARRRDRTGEH
ncbi:MAG: MFS transporter [Rhodovibrionaceae bacterium]|nr:MFS transporter [Rhodovibrionaceae bacterium]